ncbi:hypothetical protein F4X10_18575 [Candidatus Poribacteria bacterium]|nr:hypothetical protein [Candidatus Poribacteria bacterium]MYC77775.1 hypothetical protein [Candidatus Poribacteria bacterium]
MRMNSIIYLFAIPVFMVTHISGCTDTEELNQFIGNTAIAEETEVASVASKPTPEITFAKLRQEFPDEILDKDFNTLKKVTTSKNYLDFLVQTYPAVVPFETLDGFLHVAPPPPKKYEPFLKEFIATPTEKDVTNIHHMFLTYRHLNAEMHQITHEGDILGTANLIFKRVEVVQKDPIKTWMADRLADLDQKSLQKFFTDFENFVIETEKMDARQIQELFETYGKEEGLLWLAILEPALTGQVLNDFTDTEVFFKWVKGEFFLENPIIPLNLPIPQ